MSDKHWERAVNEVLIDDADAIRAIRNRVRQLEAPPGHVSAIPRFGNEPECFSVATCKSHGKCCDVRCEDCEAG